MASKLLIGIAVGFVAGILLAPDKGSESRKKVAKAGKDLKNKFNDFVDGLSNKFDSMREEADEFATSAKSQAQSFASDF